MSRVGVYQAVAARCGTVFQLASAGVAPRLGGAITKHPLDRKVAAQAVGDLRQLGAEVRTFRAQETGDDRLFVYLSGGSFVRGDFLSLVAGITCAPGAFALHTRRSVNSPEEILFALISEVRNALVPARFHLQREQGAHAQRARAAVQRTLDFTAECADALDIHLSKQPQGARR